MRQDMQDLVGKLGAHDLRELLQDLQDGKMARLIESRLKLAEREPGICPVCNNDPGPSGFTLVFGPADFRKKATFCGYDCLEYFIAKLKNHSNRDSTQRDGEVRMQSDQGGRDNQDRQRLGKERTTYGGGP